MAARYAAYQAPTKCTKAAGQGARALMAGILKTWSDAKSWGIYNCRPTALGNRSAHGEGRALDVGCSIALGRRIVKRLMEVGPEKLGISVIIHDRVIFSAKSPGGRRYPGHPHHDHVHIEMTRAAAQDQVLSAVLRILTPPAAKAREQRATDKHEPGSRTLRKGDRGTDVRYLQRHLGVRDLVADGVFGKATEAAVNRVKRSKGFAQDGICGPGTWAHILRSTN